MHTRGGVILCCLAILTSAARGDNLYTYSAPIGGEFDGYPQFNQLVISWSYDSPQMTLFADRSWSTADIGSTCTINASNDPSFSAFAALLTDGIPEGQTVMVTAPQGEGNGYGGTENFFLSRSDEDPRIDLHGYQVNSISLTLDSLSITHNVNPLYDAPYNQFNGSFTISADGIPVPEPASLLLLGYAGVGSLLWRRRK